MYFSGIKYREIRKYRTCIFINGCFWHGHENCDKYRLPKTNVEFWHKKITRNKERDIDVQNQLARMGWHVMTVWECQLDTKEKRERTLKAIEYTLNHIFLMGREKTQIGNPDISVVACQPKVKLYRFPEDYDVAMAAEEIHRD